MTEVARIFISGHSQAVRLPDALRFEGDEVIVKRFGNGVVLLPKDNSYAIMDEALSEFEEGFTLERAQTPAQERRPFEEP